MQTLMESIPYIPSYFPGGSEQEVQFQYLGWEDPLEEEMATHSSTLTGRIPQMEEPGRPQSMGSQRVGHN